MSEAESERAGYIHTWRKCVWNFNENRWRDERKTCGPCDDSRGNGQKDARTLHRSILGNIYICERDKLLKCFALQQRRRCLETLPISTRIGPKVRSNFHRFPASFSRFFRLSCKCDRGINFHFATSSSGRYARQVQVKVLRRLEVHIKVP